MNYKKYMRLKLPQSFINLANMMGSNELSFHESQSIFNSSMNAFM